MIKKVKLFINDNEKSKSIATDLKNKLLENDFILAEDEFDLGISIGGDGSFLRMIKETNYSNNILYVGINTGTLGFAQEVSKDEIDVFLDNIKNNNYKIDEIGIQETKIICEDKDYLFNSLNEIVVRDKQLNTLTLDILIDNNKLEKYVGDGMLVSTSFGSTAYNLSFGGSIVYNTFHTLQLTPVAPLNNKSYRNLLNSVIIPSSKLITMISKNKDLLVTVDGDNIVLDNVESIETTMSKKTIKCYRDNNYDFSKKINEKFLK